MAGNVYVTPQTGSIQRAVNAVPDRYTINVQAGGSYGNYTVGSRLLTVAFQNGPTLQLAADSALLPFSTTLRVTGGPQDNTHISFQAGAQAGTIAVALNGLPTGTFAPTGGIVAHGGGGQNAHITVAAQVTLDALLFADGPNAVLQGGGGPTIEVGGGGTSTVLEGGTGPNVLIAGSGSATLVGNGTLNLLIAGDVAPLRLPPPFNLEATLVQILSVWSSNYVTFAARAAAIQDFLAANHVDLLPNGAVNLLEGHGGLDLFFASATDHLHGVGPQDIVVPLQSDE